MSNLVLKAIQFAIDKHQGQFRKVSNLPYVTHPIAVSYIVASFKKSKHLDEILAACHLHDTLEDTDTTFLELASEFTPLVACLVEELTSKEDQIKEFGKLDYLKWKMKGISSYALVIKLADRLHNVTDNPTQKMKDDTKSILEYLKQKRKLSQTHKKLIEEIERYI